MAEPVYEWFQQGMALLRSGDSHAAATVLERAVAAEPDKTSVREALARAYYGAERFDDALEQFLTVLEMSPVNDYAIFGTGLCLGRLGRLDEAVGHLKMAAVMRPDNDDYVSAVRRWETRRSYRADVRQRMDAARQRRDQMREQSGEQEPAEPDFGPDPGDELGERAGGAD
ncbi:MAG TPA: tetratricopeptide repeat protein [Actinomycetota bacterium]|nr:tetratricopeptide repeat protein [Actinomycetota bacterium]